MSSNPVTSIYFCYLPIRLTRKCQIFCSKFRKQSAMGKSFSAYLVLTDWTLDRFLLRLCHRDGPSVTNKMYPNVYKSCPKWFQYKNERNYLKIGENICCHRLWKGAQSAINHPIWSYCRRLCHLILCRNLKCTQLNKNNFIALRWWLQAVWPDGFIIF